MCLRRTKEYVLDGEIIVKLPPRNVNVDESDFNKDEREFYLTLFQKAQFQFNAYVKAGTVMKNYQAVLAWILRLRQACCHPSLIFEEDNHPDPEKEKESDVPSDASGDKKSATDRLLDRMSEDIVILLIENSVEESECFICRGV
jgi:SNF2 family DNA or RNA helicase